MCSGSVKSEATSPTGPATPPPSPATDVSQAEMKLRFSLNRPEIVLVEDAMNLNTNSLFLGVRLSYAIISGVSLVVGPLTFQRIVFKYLYSAPQQP